jgi:TRAP-type C4-dicarboxylate transport system substrate-binding protein
MISKNPNLEPIASWYRHLMTLLIIDILLRHWNLWRQRKEATAVKSCKLYLILNIKIMYLSFNAWKKMMEEQNRIINEAFRRQSQMLNDAIKDFNQNNPRMISNAVRQQAEIFNQIIQQQIRIFADAMKQFDEKNEKRTKALKDGSDLSSDRNSQRRQKK